MNYYNICIIGIFLVCSLAIGAFIIWRIIRDVKKKKKKKEEQQKEVKRTYYKEFIGWIYLTAFLFALILLIYSNLGVFLIEILKNQNNIGKLENEPHRIINESKQVLKKAKDENVAETTVEKIKNVVSLGVFSTKLSNLSFYNDVSTKCATSEADRVKNVGKNTQLKQVVADSSCAEMTEEVKNELLQTGQHLRAIKETLKDISDFLSPIETLFADFENLFNYDRILLLQRFKDDIAELQEICEELMNQSTNMEMRTLFIVFLSFFSIYSLILTILIVLAIVGYFILFRKSPNSSKAVQNAQSKKAPNLSETKTETSNLVKYSLYGSFLLLFISSLTYLVIYLEVIEPTNNCVFEQKNYTNENDTISIFSVCPSPNSSFFSVLQSGSSFSPKSIEKGLKLVENEKKFNEKAEKPLNYNELVLNGKLEDEIDTTARLMNHFKDFEETKCKNEKFKEAYDSYEELHLSLRDLNSSIAKFNDKRKQTKTYKDIFVVDPFEEIRKNANNAVSAIFAANFNCTTIYELIYAKCRLNGFVLDDFVIYVFIQLASNLMVVFVNIGILALKMAFDNKKKMEEEKRMKEEKEKKEKEKKEEEKRKKMEEKKQKANEEEKELDQQLYLKKNADNYGKQRNDDLNRELAEEKANLEHAKTALNHEINHQKFGTPVPETLVVDGPIVPMK